MRSHDKHQFKQDPSFFKEGEGLLIEGGVQYEYPNTIMRSYSKSRKRGDLGDFPKLSYNKEEIGTQGVKYFRQRCRQTLYFIK